MNQQALAELANRARERDIEAFGRIYDTCVDSVYRYAFFKIGNRQDAEDVTEETFLRAFKSIGRYEQQDCPFTAWLFRIAQMAVADFYRSRSRAPAVERGHEAADTALDSEAHKDLEKGLHAEDLVLLVKRLSPDQQNVIVLRFLSGLKLSETAAMLGKNENSVKALQHRALDALKKIIEAEK